MKNIKLQAKFLNLLIIISTLLVFSKGEIIDNPIFISDNANPIMLGDYENLEIIFTSGGAYVFNEEGRVEGNYSFANYSAPYTLIVDESYNYFIFTNKEYLKLGLTDDGEYETSSEEKPTGNGITYPNSDKHIGSIIEHEIFEVNCYCEIKENEVIIYGRYSEPNNNYLSFTFLKQQKSYNIKINGTLEGGVECIPISGRIYICAIVQDYKVKICFFGYIKKDGGTCEMNNVYEGTMEQMSQHTYVKLYAFYLLFLCAKNNKTNDIECLNIMVLGIPDLCQEPQFSSILKFSDILFRIPTSSANEQDCAFSLFVDELLFCCGDGGFIQCSRFSMEMGSSLSTNLISTYKLSLPGSNSKLSIFNPKDYVYFIFSNKNSDETKIYEYFIYLPNCKNVLAYTIIVHHSLNEKKQDTEKVDLNKLFERKTNTNYYVEFDTLPDEYGDLKVNGEKIISEKNTKILIEKDNTYILDFNSTNDNSVDNFQIDYRILIEETYSAKCSINLKILPCYDSCAECSKERDSSSSDEHNCLPFKCKSEYYPSPSIDTNCFKEEEKEINWYLDSETKRFAICNEACKSCNGPNSNNCLTCFTLQENQKLTYLLDGKCINECPEGTYVVEQSEGYYKCEKCHPNCKTCKEKGNDDNMKCESCNENDITYSQNCYKEKNSKDKTFYKPQSSEVTSCLELLKKYIKENTYQCVDSIPTPGYFLANPKTGLFAKCHSNCTTCSQNYTDLTTNCDTCANSELYLLDGNCIATCPEGYYHTVSNDIKVCKKCYKNCLNCTEGEIYSNSVLTDMNCLYCKKGEDPNDSNNLIENQIKIYNNCFPIIIYTNEKITFNTSDMSSGETEKSCLDYGKAIMPGKYECIEKPTNYFYVVQDDNNTGIIELCDEVCSTCTWGKNNLTNNTNCINCTEGYFKTQDSNTNCILESLIPENYLKNDSDNIYYKCHSNCQKCDEYYDIAKDDMHCTQCPKDFYFLYGTNNCYNMSFVDENSYYFSKEDNKYHQCYLNCLRCSQPGSDENNQNCDKCISGFYFKNGTQNCYNNSILENGYYLDNFTISPGENPTYKKCYENCKTCNNTITNNSNMNCISCKDNFYKINGTNNCYNETLKAQGYYLKENIFYPCEDNCKTCSDSKTEINGTISNNCLSCDYSTKNLYLVSTLKNCEPEEFKEKGYYLAQDLNDSNTKIFYECYFSCALCDKGKESSNHNCLSCRENFYPKKDDINTNNCYNETEMIPQGYVLINNYWTFYDEISTTIYSTTPLKETKENNNDSKKGELE